MSMSSLQSLLLFNSLYFNSVRGNTKVHKNSATPNSELAESSELDKSQKNEVLDLEHKMNNVSIP